MGWERRQGHAPRRRQDATGRRPVHKGLILVDAPGTKRGGGALATVTTEGKEQIRIGDHTQPSFDCKMPSEPQPAHR